MRYKNRSMFQGMVEVWTEGCDTLRFERWSKGIWSVYVLEGNSFVFQTRIKCSKSYPKALVDKYLSLSFLD